VPNVSTRIDHLVVTGPTLQDAARYLEQQLHMAPTGGGQHAAMGTHNLLLATSDDTYVEAIAIDPRGEAPGTPRWFGLDHGVDSSALRAWVVRAADLADLAAPEDLGSVRSLARDDLRWQITVPDTGLPPVDGVAPAVIAWQSPPPDLPTSPVRLISLTILHPDIARVNALLQSLDLVGPVTVQADLSAGLIAAYETPDGPAFLATPGLTEPSLDRERQIAMDLFHASWRLLDLPALDNDQRRALIECATASLWHWRRVGAPTQWAIGEWQCSRVYAVLGDGATALLHAQRSLAICESERVDDFVPASAHEALARAYAVLGDMEEARHERNLSYRIAVDLDDEDRDVIEHDLGTLPIHDA